MLKKLWQNVKPFLSNPGTSRTGRRTVGQTDRIAISISRVSVLMRDKNSTYLSLWETTGATATCYTVLKSPQLTGNIYLVDSMLLSWIVRDIKLQSWRCWKVLKMQHDVMGAPLGSYHTVPYIFRKLMLSSDWQLTLRLTVFDIFTVQWQQETQLSQRDRAMLRVIEYLNFSIAINSIILQIRFRQWGPSQLIEMGVFDLSPCSLQSDSFSRSFHHFCSPLHARYGYAASIGILMWALTKGASDREEAFDWGGLRGTLDRG